MAAAQKVGADFTKYPHLDADEFAEVCHHIDRRYTQATLGPVRRRWKLRVCRALDVSFSMSAGYTTYVQITRPLDGELDDGDLSSYLDSFSFGDEDKEMTSTQDHEMAEAEQADSVWLQWFRLQV